MKYFKNNGSAAIIIIVLIVILGGGISYGVYVTRTQTSQNDDLASSENGVSEPAPISDICKTERDAILAAIAKFENDFQGFTNKNAIGALSMFTADKTAAETAARDSLLGSLYKTPPNNFGVNGYRLIGGQPKLLKSGACYQKLEEARLFGTMSSGKYEYPEVAFIMVKVGGEWKIDKYAKWILSGISSSEVSKADFDENYMDSKSKFDGWDVK